MRKIDMLAMFLLNFPIQLSHSTFDPKADILCGMIHGAHVLLYSKNADADRAFFRDVLDFPSVDAGHGWLIFMLPPAEVAIHPVDAGQSAEEHKLLDAALYLMCDDLDALIVSLKAKKVQCTKIERQRWGITTTIPLPSGGTVGLYQPTHPTALHLSSK